MHDKIDIIESNCGVKPPNQKLIHIENDPNFIFENDPDFLTLRLFNEEGNVINVNSWIECATYVDGGWSITEFSINGDLVYFLVTLSISVCYIFFRSLRLKYD